MIRLLLVLFFSFYLPKEGQYLNPDLNDRSSTNTGEVGYQSHSDSSGRIFMRVTFSKVYNRPFFLSVFADYYKEPWFSTYYITRSGLRDTPPPKEPSSWFTGNERSGWIEITPLMQAETGARLMISTAYSDKETTPVLGAKFEFASHPNEKSVVKTITRESEPGFVHILMPPDLSTPGNVAKLKTDQEEAAYTGKIADRKTWPSIGKKPAAFPFFVTTHLDTLIETGQVDNAVAGRELKTLAYFGFNGSNRATREVRNSCGFTRQNITSHVLWGLRDNNSYLEPRVSEMEAAARSGFARFVSEGGTPEQIDYYMLIDEPFGADTDKLAAAPVAHKRFREWLQAGSKTISGLFPGGNGSETWDLVRPVTDSEKYRYPALYYYTQKFRTYSLGSYMQVQKDILHRTYGKKFPAVANFSDGVLYAANFYMQGVDYFELMETTSQNAIWSEDWANISSTYQCSAFNVDLLRAAARRQNARIGSYLIAHAGRKPWDVKLKAMSAAARGVKIFNNFYYGPYWGAREGGWNADPGNWTANAEIIREIGGAEELFFPAKNKKSEVAILYSSSSDIWNLDRNHAYGFDRMHTWLALAHAQIASDILSERDIEDNILDTYKVCYFSGTHITEKAALRLKQWVERGGTLILTAGAAAKNEYNQPISNFENILPVRRNDPEELESYLHAGRNINHLKQQETVQYGETQLAVLSVKQSIIAKSGTEIPGKFSNGTSAVVKGKYGKGTIYYYGFLPALSYIKQALDHRTTIEKEVKNPATPDASRYVAEKELIGRSYNPWAYPAGIRNVLIAPVMDAALKLPLKCSEPLVDAVLMESSRGLVIPLSNYTLQPLREITLSVKTSKKVSHVKSVHKGDLNFNAHDSAISFSLPLQETDVVLIFFE